jgi:hypothetical protein
MDQHQTTVFFIHILFYFRWTGQDWTRSSVFGISSLLLPAGQQSFQNLTILVAFLYKNFLPNPDHVLCFHQLSCRIIFVETVQYSVRNGSDSFNQLIEK